MSYTKLTREERQQIGDDDPQATRRRRLGVRSGVAAVATTAALLVATHHSRDAAPVDVSKLPQDQITQVTVKETGSHYPSGIAEMIINHDTPLNQATAEIQSEIEGSTVPTGAVIELPTSQIDPAALKRYESGQNR